MSEEPADRAFERQVVAQAPRADGAREAGAVGNVPGAEDADLARVPGEPAIAADDEADVGVGDAGATEDRVGVRDPALDEDRAVEANRGGFAIGADAGADTVSVEADGR